MSANVGRIIYLQPLDLQIAAPRHMVFQMLSAIGSGQLPGAPGDSARVLSRDGNTIVAEFHTKAGWRTFVTVEEITLYPPERITFQHLKGPLSYVHEEITLDEQDTVTVLRYRGEFFVNSWPLLGWFVGRLYVRPLFQRTVGHHLHGIKKALEDRASRSHVLPKAPSSASEERGAS